MNPVMILGPCRVSGDPTDEACTRFRFARSITRIGNVILIHYDAINKTDRKTFGNSKTFSSLRATH